VEESVWGKKLANICPFEVSTDFTHLNEVTFFSPPKISETLRRIFGFKTEEVAGVWRKIHNEELHTLYSSPNIIRVNKIKKKKKKKKKKVGQDLWH
jgi:hypothetical protein